MAIGERALVRRLVQRAAFGASPSEMDRYERQGFDRTLDELLHPERADTSAFEAALTQQDFDLTRVVGLQRWWLYRMLNSPRPVEERITLFWHGHFTTAAGKVNRPPLLLQQNNLFRSQGLGSFGALLHAVSKDPAMLIWLDGNRNRKGAPNENYAREVMELFTIGIGSYTEEDVREAARAFTGWTVNRDGEFTFAKNQHDTGSKTFLGQTGNLDGDAVLDILLSRPETDQLISRKLIRFFVTDSPSDENVKRIAGAFRRSGGDVRSTLEAVFRSPEFAAESSYHASIKSPVDFFVGSAKRIGAVEVPLQMPGLLSSMGQALFNPPNVAGWPGGKSWLTTSAAMARANFAEALTNGRFGTMPLSNVVGERSTATGAVDRLADWLVDGDLTDGARSTLAAFVSRRSGDPAAPADPTRTRIAARLLVASPAYQLC